VTWSHSTTCYSTALRPFAARASCPSRRQCCSCHPTNFDPDWHRLSAFQWRHPGTSLTYIQCNLENSIWEFWFLWRHTFSFHGGRLTTKRGNARSDVIGAKGGSGKSGWRCRTLGAMMLNWCRLTPGKLLEKIFARRRNGVQCLLQQRLDFFGLNFEWIALPIINAIV